MNDQTKASKEEIIKMRKAGRQLSEIAAHFGMDKMDVRDICKKVDRNPQRQEKQGAPTTNPEA